MSYFILFYNINKALCCGSFICDHINSITQLLDFPFQAHFPPQAYFLLPVTLHLSVFPLGLLSSTTLFAGGPL